jgi:fatty-acyl-CoA synthase
MSHARSHAMEPLVRGHDGCVQPTDRMYNCLPMYHSVGGVHGAGCNSRLAAAASSFARSSRQVSSGMTSFVGTALIFQYIGELCRYLLHAPTPASHSIDHKIRMACGNGLASEVWDMFKDRFKIPHIFEFYAATEGGVALFNIEGKRGAIGHIPGYLIHRFSPPLVKFDVEKGEPVRNDQGFCIRCAPNEIGEAIGRIVDDPTGVGSRFEGYTDDQCIGKEDLSRRL